MPMFSACIVHMGGSWLIALTSLRSRIVKRQSAKHQLFHQHLRYDFLILSEVSDLVSELYCSYSKLDIIFQILLPRTQKFTEYMSEMINLDLQNLKKYFVIAP
jgi:hypothetical protein